MAWSTVAAVALAGVLLSLVTLVRAPDESAPTVEVRGPAAVREQPETPGARPSGRGDGDRVGRSSAGLPLASPADPRPVLLRAPAIELAAPVDAVGVAGDRQMQLPRDPRRLGWYRFGPTPDSGRGSAVLAGHVDSETYGVGPLARLGELRPGDPVSVRLTTGRWRRFRVDSVQAFERRSLPDSVFTRSGPERLRLVTCTGPYLPDAGGYQENLVVTAVPARVASG